MRTLAFLIVVFFAAVISPGKVGTGDLPALSADKAAVRAGYHEAGPNACSPAIGAACYRHDEATHFSACSSAPRLRLTAAAHLSRRLQI
jgi:hypothetical protein